MSYVLHVAEKPSVANSVAGILSEGKSNKQPGISKFNPNHFFSRDFGNTPNAQHCVTSVSGHILGIEFEELFDAPIHKKKNLHKLSRESHTLVLWLDCDREGENIAFEVIDVCEKAKQGHKILRAHFNSLVPAEIFKAYRTLTEPNKLLSKAVDVRQELDLRIGSAFTRFQTSLLQQRHPSLKEKVISYGPCQFPTLGFVVDRYYQIKAFTKEKFYKIQCSLIKNGTTVETNWSRVRIFDRIACFIIYEDSLPFLPKAYVEDVTERQKIVYKPHPLTTVDLQKACSRFLKINSKKTMDIAEKLYQSGLISYPRTETNIYPSDMNHNNIVTSLSSCTTYSDYCRNLLANGLARPRNGSSTDNSHSPIHPTRAPPQQLQPDHFKVYDFVVRNYLATVSEDATTAETKVSVIVGEERFVATGTVMQKRGFLDIFPFRKCTTKELPQFTKGERVNVQKYEIGSGETTPPKPITEPELISLMDKNGIGTDATIAQHIEKITEREYVVVVKNAYAPTNLGLALIEGYDSMGFEFSRPLLRAQTERELFKIGNGEADPETVSYSFLQQYQEYFTRATMNRTKLVNSILKYFKKD
ncbi:DNA topoisomerase [Entamoeba marina]